ncbi:MAG: hypothetical protein ACHP93_04565 [Solirubrobacterales bacterium]
MRLITRRLTPLAAAACVFLTPVTAGATSTAKEIKTSKDNGVSYLKSLQLPNGSLGTDWALSALAAAGTAAADVKTSEGSTDARTYYRALFGDTSTWPGGSEPPVTEFERAALNSYAAGVDPARVSRTQNLIAQIAARYEPSSPGYYGGSFTGAVFALLALADTKTRTGALRVPEALLEKSIAVLRANQHTDGGWTFEKAEGSAEKLEAPAEPDETGAAMAGLCTAGVSSTDPTIARAREYLKATLVALTGAFNAPFGVNTDSNAWGVQGLDACKIAPQEAGFTTSMGKTPIDFLISQQLSGGGFRFEPSEGTANGYSSQDAVRALSGAGFTAAPPRPKSGSRWVFEGNFLAGVHSPLTLIVNNGTTALKVCSISVAPQKPTTTIAAVLEAAQAGSSPAGCVISFMPASGTGPITQVSGSPSPAAARWNVSIDGAKARQAKRSTPIHLGDTISLQLG